MRSKIWLFILFKKRKNLLVVLALTIITGIYISQNYFFDAFATRYIQQQASIQSYDAGGYSLYSSTSDVSNRINTEKNKGFVADSVTFTIISLPHVNFTRADITTEEELLGNDTRVNLESGALLWVNIDEFNSKFRTAFNITAQIQPGIYLQRSISSSFNLSQNIPSNFSFGSYFESINVSRSSEIINYTTITQNQECKGYFDFFNNSIVQLHQIIAQMAIKYTILCIWMGEFVNPTKSVMPPYYIGIQKSVFFVKMNFYSLNCENLDQKMREFYSSISSIFQTGYYFAYIADYQFYLNEIENTAQNSVFKTISFIIISAIFFYWFFSSIKDTRMNPVIQDLTYGVTRKRILRSFLSLEIILAIIGATCANGLGLTLGYIIYTLGGLDVPFFFSLSSVYNYFIRLIFYNLILIIIFSIPSIIKILKTESIRTSCNSLKSQDNELRVKGWQVAACIIIFTFVGISLIPASRMDMYNPFFLLISINRNLNSILSPTLPFLLALGIIWIFIVLFSKVQKRMQKRNKNIQPSIFRSIKNNFQRGIRPEKRTLVFLLLIGVTSAVLLSSYAGVNSMQERNKQEAFGWVGGSFSIGTSSFTNHFDQIYNDVLQIVQSRGFIGEYEIVHSTRITINDDPGQSWLHFINTQYFANLSQFSDAFFYDPKSKEVNLNNLQENCTILPYYTHFDFNLNLGDIILVKVYPSSPFNGTGIPISLKITGFYYAFPGLKTHYGQEPLVCSNHTFKYFQNHSVVTRILFNSVGDTSQLVEQLNSTFGYYDDAIGYDDSTQIFTLQGELERIQLAYSLELGLLQYFNYLYLFLLFGEFLVAFNTILQEDRTLIILLRIREEKFSEIKWYYIKSYGTLLLTGLGGSLFLGLLTSLMAVNSLNTTFFSTWSNNLWIPYPFVFPWIEFGIIGLIFLMNFWLILLYFFRRIKKANFSSALRQASK